MYALVLLLLCEMHIYVQLILVLVGFKEMSFVLYKVRQWQMTYFIVYVLFSFVYKSCAPVKTFPKRHLGAVLI